MYPPLRERKTTSDVLLALSESLDLRHVVLARRQGMADHGLFGAPDDVVDAKRALERLGMRCTVNEIGKRWVLLIKNVWTPRVDATGEKQ
jgi:hypothetical protein